MTLWQTLSGKWTTFCRPCKYGVIQPTRAAVLSWAINHSQKHQKGEAQ